MNYVINKSLLTEVSAYKSLKIIHWRGSGGNVLALYTHTLTVFGSNPDVEEFKNVLPLSCAFVFLKKIFICNYSIIHQGDFEI